MAIAYIPPVSAQTPSTLSGILAGNGGFVKAVALSGGLTFDGTTLTAPPGGVTSFNTRSGAVSLTLADVVAALAADVVVGANSFTAVAAAGGAAGNSLTLAGSAAAVGSGLAGGNVVLSLPAGDGAGVNGKVVIKPTVAATGNVTEWQDFNANVKSGVDANGRIFAGGVPNSNIPSLIKIVSSDPNDAFFGAATGAKIVFLESYVGEGGIDTFDYGINQGLNLNIGGYSTGGHTKNVKLWANGKNIATLINGFIINNVGDVPAAVIPLTVKGSVAQTGDILQCQNSGGTVLMKVDANGLVYPVQAPTVSAPAYAQGGLYYDSTLKKLRVGGATAWETVTSS